ncbi:MAG: immunoglobulin domain-containing protein, partial [Sedimentisphaerales bacterium]|nr:immunoglobulin domain-containing protein [Sedimentisphaerales bacterium]
VMAVSSPYPVDANTLHLWHFDGVVEGGCLDMVRSGTQDMLVTNGAIISDSISGFGKALNTYNGGSSRNWFIGDNVNKSFVSDFVGANGAFTFEAIVKPMVNQNAITHHMEIICLEDDGNTGSERGFQFRINTDGKLRFQVLAGSTAYFDTPITYTSGQWYHAAVTYNGLENTADNIRFYWTELGTATTASQAGTGILAADMKADTDGFFAVGNELRANGGYTENFEGLIDEVRISKTARTADDMMLRASLPWANNPVPAPATMLASLDSITQLQWQSAELPNITAHYVYISKDEPNFFEASPEPNFVGPAPMVITDITNPITTGTLPITLENDAKYYWRVDESINSSSATSKTTVRGPIWMFETTPSAPVIVGQPQGVRVKVAEPYASLECAFTSISAPTVMWYKAGSTTPLVNGGDVAITLTGTDNSYTAVLKIATPVAADQGEYYCTITNNATEVRSDNGYIIVNRLLAQYDFEDSLVSTAGELDAPTGTGKSLAGQPDTNEINAQGMTPGYETGFDGSGKAVILNNGEYIDFGLLGYPRAGTITNGHGLGMDAGTLVCWIKPAASGVIYQNFNDGSATGISFAMSTTEASELRMYERSEAGDVVNIGGEPDRPMWELYDGNWHMLACTWEVSGSSTVYIDGQPVITANSSNSQVFAAWQRSVLLGAGRQTANRDLLQLGLASSVDYLRIYNYRLDAESNTVFAQEYLDATGIVPCVNTQFDGYQFNFDNTGSSYCRVDLADFAYFAGQWLTSGLFDGE